MRIQTTIQLDGTESVSAHRTSTGKYVAMIGSVFIMADDLSTVVGTLQRAIDGLHDAHDQFVAESHPSPNHPSLTVVPH